MEAPCIDACISGALIRDAESGMVTVREDRCIGCWTCTMFCPYGVIFPWPERKFALKCDRCVYMEAPVCVQVCPTGAIELMAVEELEERFKAKRLKAMHRLCIG
jgi:carbon-monoxide dehydrogenase iron sulfur subunit